MLPDECLHTGGCRIERRDGVKYIPIVECADDVLAKASASFDFEPVVTVSTSVGRHHIQEVDTVGLQDKGVAVEQAVGEVFVNLEFLRVWFEAGIANVQFATGNIFLFDGSADEEVRSNVVPFRQFVSVTESLDDLLLVNVAFVLRLLEDI